MHDLVMICTSVTISIVCYLILDYQDFRRDKSLWDILNRKIVNNSYIHATEIAKLKKRVEKLERSEKDV